MDETKLECSNGWVKIERITDERESVKLTTNIHNRGELTLRLNYDLEKKANTSFDTLSKSNPDDLQAGILENLGL
jgi:hypothetical protein